MLLRDTFDITPIAGDPDFGLNADLTKRQSGTLAPAHYSRLPGVWFESPPAAAELVRVGDRLQDGSSGKLSFHGFSAIRLDAPLGPDESGAWHVSARLNPVVNDTKGMSWLSIILRPQRESLGWVTNEGNLVGLLVRSNGEVGLFSHGNVIPLSWATKPPAAAPTYAVSFSLHPVATKDGRALRLEGSVNDMAFTATLLEGKDIHVPESLFLNLGAHYHPKDQSLSWIDDLELSGSPTK